MTTGVKIVSLTPGFLVIDKAPGLTSHDVVATVRAVTGIRKVGHTGTLDPLASGVLPLALGKATRFIQYLDENLKIYDATIGLGAATTTGDREGEVIREAPVPALDDLAAVTAVLEGFVGERMQVPPAYSAVKVKGKPLYKYAREGVKVEVPARKITIHGLELIEAGAGSMRVMIRCSRGTYARVLAEEIGVALGSAGHLSALRRLRSGPFTLERSLPLPGLAQIVAGTDEWERAFRRPGPGEERIQWRPRATVLSEMVPYRVTLADALIHLPRVAVAPADRARVLSGGRPPNPPGGCRQGALYLVVDGEEALAIAESRGPTGRCVRAVSKR